MKIKRGRIVVVLLAAVLIAACDTPEWIIVDSPPSTSAEIPPFVITKPQMEIIERQYYFNYAGITFNFLNKAEKPVDNITVSFMLFDPDTGESPFITSNKFQITRWDTLFPGDSKEIIISLDQFIYVAPMKPYLIDFFYIYGIHYVDDTVWRDEYGKHMVRR